MLDTGPEAPFRVLIERSSDGVVVVNRDGIVRFLNPAAEALLQRKAEHLLGGVFGIPVAPGDCTEIDIVHGAEHGLVVEMRVVEIEWDGEPAYLATLHDVTERKRAAEALRFLAEASTELTASLDTPTTLTTTARLAVGHLADWCLIDLFEENTVRRAVAHPADPALVGACQSLCGAARLDANAEAGVARVLCTGQAELWAKDEDILWELLCLFPEQKLPPDLGCAAAMIVPLAARGRTLGTVSFIAAGPHRRYTPRDLALAEDLARRAALAIDNAALYEAREAVRRRDELLAQTAREALRQRDEFLAMMGHELRNPLAPILHGLGLLKARPPADECAGRIFGVIERQAQQIARLLDDLLDLSRVTRGKIELRKQAVELGTVVGDAVETSRPLLEGNRHTLTVSLPPAPIHLEADPTRLGQVISNLLNNAAKYTPPGGKVELNAGLDGDEVVLRVRDTGIGIPPEKLGEVFEPFRQLDCSPERSKGGLGIGLTLVRTLVQLHGGTVTALSAGKDRGTEVVVRLPRGQVLLPEPVEEKAPRRAPRCRVVLVDDHAEGRAMLRDLLRLWGHEVEEAADGPEGLEVLRRLPADVALIDIELPRMNGYQLARAIRSLPGSRDMVLVALTGFGQAEDRQRALEAGFDAHLLKPPDLQELEQFLSLCHRRPRSRSPGPGSVGC